MTQGFLHLRQVVSAQRRCDLQAQAGEETQLHHEADLALIILVDVRRSGVELLLAHRDIAGDEHISRPQICFVDDAGRVDRQGRDQLAVAQEISQPGEMHVMRQRGLDTVRQPRYL